MQKSSPEYLRLSLAAAMTLGLKKGRFYRDAKLYCLNLLLTYPDGCRAACTYCGLARPARVDTNNSPATSFIRVEWPAYTTDLIIEKANECSSLERACISTLTHPNNRKDTYSVLNKLRDKTDLPVSILSNPTPTTTDDMKALYDAGADRFTVAIDLATEDLFEKHRGEIIKGPHRWNRY